MMYYYLDIEVRGQTERHIFFKNNEIVSCFPLTDDNPNTAGYLAWVAEGNTPEEWTGA